MVLKDIKKEDKVYLTREALDNFQKEYELLTQMRRPQLVARLNETRVIGSLEENNEHAQVRQDLAFITERIAELEEIFKKTVLIKPSKADIVTLGSTVVVETEDGLDEFMIVGTLEADPANNKISNESPIGQALLGKKVGETVVVKTSIVNHSCKIIKIK